ncbi:MAG: hypothetical protein WBB67_03715 [bacterium]
MLTVVILGSLIYFDAVVSKSLIVNGSMIFTVHFLGGSLLGLLHRKFLAKEMHYVAHLWCEKVDPKAKPYPIFEIYIVGISLLFLLVAIVVLIKNIIVLW